MTARFADKVALVTGGGTGIGRATAAALAREGAYVVVAGRNPATIDATVDLVTADGGKASAITADVTDEDQVAGLVGATVERHGGLDVAVNNAGRFGGGHVADLDQATWTDVLAVNVTGVGLAMKHEIAAMRPRGGAIVNIGSNIGAHLSMVGTGAYAASKAAVNALTRTAALEVVRDGIRVNAVSPGAVDAPMSLAPGETPEERHERMKDSIPLGRVAAVSEVVAAILWLASDDSASVIGHDVVIDGGTAA